MTEELWRRMVPLDQAPDEVREAIQATLRRGRGKQKAPTKRMVSLRLDRDVLEAYRATGRGWQSRMNQTLAEHAPRAARRRSAPKPRATAKPARPRRRSAT